MNKIVKRQSPSNYFHKFFWEVYDADGNLFARIYRNKHGRTNMSRLPTAGNPQGEFMAGGSNSRAVMQYAREVDPKTTNQYFVALIPGTKFFDLTTLPR